MRIHCSNNSWSSDHARSEQRAIRRGIQGRLEGGRGGRQEPGRTPAGLCVPTLTGSFAKLNDCCGTISVGLTKSTPGILVQLASTWHTNTEPKCCDWNCTGERAYLRPNATPRPYLVKLGKLHPKQPPTGSSLRVIPAHEHAWQSHREPTASGLRNRAAHQPKRSVPAQQMLHRDTARSIPDLGRRTPRVLLHTDTCTAVRIRQLYSNRHHATSHSRHGDAGQPRCRFAPSALTIENVSSAPRCCHEPAPCDTWILPNRRWRSPQPRI